MFVLLAPLLASPIAVHAQTDYSDLWSRFSILVWQYKTPPPGSGAVRAYDALNLTGIHLDDDFPRDLLDFALENDYDYYLDHAAGKGDLYLYKKEWDAFFDAYKKDRSRPVRPRSLHDPALRERLLARLRANIPRAKVGQCLAYAFDDEISTTSFTAPADVCWSESSLAAFRQWLERRYGTVETLNKRWGTSFPSFAEAEPATVDDVRSVHALPFSKWNLARWADHREFMDDTLAEILATLREEANRLDPARPAGFVGAQAPTPYGGFDYAKLSRAVQFMEAYDIGGTNELLRSFWGTTKPRVQTFFATGKPHVDKWFLWNALVHGNRGVIAWPEVNGASWFEGNTPRPEIQALAETFADVQGLLGEYFVGARYLSDGVGVYYSHPSVRVSWMMDIQPHGNTWVNRSSSLNNANASDLLNRVAWTKWLEDAGIGYEFVSYLDVKEGKEDLNRLKVLILPRTFCLSDGEAGAIREFVRRGGILIADYGAGLFDEFGTGRVRGALDDVFAAARGADAKVLDGTTIAEVNAEKYTLPLKERCNYAGARRAGEFVLYERILRGLSGTRSEARQSGADFVVQNRLGKGQAFYLNATPIPYLWKRRESGGEAYRALLLRLLATAGVSPRVDAYRNGQPAPTVERLFWEKAEETYLCLIENPLRDALVDGMGDVDGIPSAERETLELRFATPVRELFDERANKSYGSGQVFQVEWCPHEAGVYRIAPKK